MSKIDAITLHSLNTKKNPGGDDRSRTDDPRLAKPVLYQLSYTPKKKIRVSLPNGGPDESRTCDLTLIRRAL